MQHSQRSAVTSLLAAFIVIGTAAGLAAAYSRFHVEQRNGAVEIGLEWQEVAQLAQATRTPVTALLADFKAQGVSALVIQEDTVGGLEQAGALHPQKQALPGGRYVSAVVVDDPAAFQRIAGAFARREIPASESETGVTGPVTLFTVAGNRPNSPSLLVGADYSNLRSVGVGLPPDAVASAGVSGLAIAGRIGNFPAVTVRTARAVLSHLREQGASMVIFSGDEVLGYRGQEKEVAALLRDPSSTGAAAGDPAPTGLAYGAVEFGKQRGDEKLSGALHGDIVRVHSIQAAEMGQMEEADAVERFEKAARERNIRFCYVRLLTLAGADAVHTNVEYLRKISLGIAHGSRAVGGDLKFGMAARYQQTGVSPYLFALMALGAAGGSIWMLRALVPVPDRESLVALAALALICVAMTLRFDETGRKLVALLAGIAFPTAACLAVYPRRGTSRPAPTGLCISGAISDLGLATAITAIGIIHVVGLLATRPFMVEANQFMGIKAQHGIPIVLMVAAALAGGAALPSETWLRYRARATSHIRAAMSEPARFGVLLLGFIALVTLAIIIARTGNDAGVGVSGTEMKVRAILDRVLPVRPRTKEFLIGHPFFVLGLAWWRRGRRTIAIPCFLVGVLGQVSLLNTFCHIHTPLLISLWRDVLGLVIGAAIGVGIFVLFERVAPPPVEGETS